MGQSVDIWVTFLTHLNVGMNMFCVSWKNLMLVRKVWKQRPVKNILQLSRIGTMMVWTRPLVVEVQTAGKTCVIFKVGLIIC